ncbi:unnamed protein product [Rhizoctonia solani]|uniref:Protein kinase domain-containing protein n=1 Tax=Rhizoctonia solani TaxID=456999 RepID=A0A8H2X3J2_9AGAM|nr:unnamed protein product [Rhizoctonia solani]
MKPNDVVELLTNHGCVDLSLAMDENSCSQYPVANGGLGDVFQGKLWDGTLVAVKTIRPHSQGGELTGVYQKQAAKEIYTWSKCSHPNVVPLMGLAVFRNSLAMISLWEKNGNLLHYLSKHPSANCCNLSISICAGLAYLHENNIIHGDLKGANVLIAQDGTPRLIDFGNSVVVDATLQFTRSNTGPSYSIRWTAPEILQGITSHTMMGDVYSLGMTILETLTASIPFSGKAEQSLYIHVVIKKQTPLRPTAIIPEKSIYGNVLWALLMSCWVNNSKCCPDSATVWNVMKPLTAEKLVEIPDDAEVVQHEVGGNAS